MEIATANKGMEASLTPSLEPQSALRCQETPHQDVLEKGQDMERSMVELTASIEAIDKEVEENDYSIKEYIALIDKVHGLKCKLTKTHADWVRLCGPSADTAVGTEVTNLNLRATKLINTIRKKLGGDDSKVDTEITENPSNKSSLLEHSDNNLELNPCKLAEKTTSPTSKKSISNKSPERDISGYANLLATAKDNDTKPSSKVSNSKRGKKSSVRTGSKSFSKPGTRASTTGSSAAKLQLMLEEAETKVEEKFNRELSNRDQRRINRERKKVNAQRERQERERAQDMEWQERERKREIERQNETLEREQERAQDESEDRDALLRRKKASIKARREVIERIEENDEESVVEKSTDAENSLSALPSEVTADEKAAAFIVKLPPTQNQQPGIDEERRTETISGESDVDKLISRSRSLINESRLLLERNKVVRNKEKEALTCSLPSATVSRETVTKVENSIPSKVVTSESRIVIPPDLFRVDKETVPVSSEKINQNQDENLIDRNSYALNGSKNMTHDKFSDRVSTAEQSRKMPNKVHKSRPFQGTEHQIAFTVTENQKKSFVNTQPRSLINCPQSEGRPLVIESSMRPSMNTVYSRPATSMHWAWSDQPISNLPIQSASVINPPVEIRRKNSEFQNSTPVINDNVSNIPTEFAYIAGVSRAIRNPTADS